jgi:hypothetical protein
VNAPRPRWLAGLIAKHGEPLIVREVADDGWAQEHTWPGGMSVRLGRTWHTHYAVATRGMRSAQVNSDVELADADISAVVALAGLDDAPERAS